MDKALFITLLVIVIFSFLLLIIIIFNNKFNFSIIKIKESEDNINLYLNKKKDLLIKLIDIVKKELKKEDFFKDFYELDNNIDLFKLNNGLNVNYNKVFKLVNENNSLVKNNNIIDLIAKIDDNDDNLLGTILFYNDSVVLYNSLLKSFPTNFIGFFKGFKTKDFYNSEIKKIDNLLEN